ncbi:Uncharacterised protein [Bordetella ansorpii]|uniref:Uncharacterized protein n=1 Tax=Bordetella ansorpii TaxID=288768 RepID=A0A157S909_9BORD|nr:hypothetical protein [Bordetella ansorpii]SAI66912.1 Uncharacterised protein [Bordetella ansorpii]
MNSISAIAQAIAEGAAALAPGQEVHMPVDEHRMVRLLRRTVPSTLGLSVATLAVGRTEEQQAAAREALLRVGADSRFTLAFAGGLDDEGRDCLLAELAEPVDAATVELLLDRMLERCAAPAQRFDTPASDDVSLSPIDMAARWLRV